MEQTRMEQNQTRRVTGRGVDVFTGILLRVFFFTGIVIEIALPWLVPFLATLFHREEIMAARHVIASSWMIAGIPCLVILWNLGNMVQTVVDDNCFVRSNVISLKRMEWCAFVITAVMIVRIFLYQSVGTLVVMIVFFLAGLFCSVLARVFDRAVSYKEDDDMTI